MRDFDIRTDHDGRRCKIDQTDSARDRRLLAEPASVAAGSTVNENQTREDEHQWTVHTYGVEGYWAVFGMIEIMVGGTIRRLRHIQRPIMLRCLQLKFATQVPKL